MGRNYEGGVAAETEQNHCAFN